MNNFDIKKLLSESFNLFQREFSTDERSMVLSSRNSTSNSDIFNNELLGRDFKNPNDAISSFEESFPRYWEEAGKTKTESQELFNHIFPDNVINDLLKNGSDSQLKEPPRTNLDQFTKLLEDMKSNLSEEVKLPTSQINKPLSTYGDITVNELINKITDVNLSFITDAVSITAYPVKLLPAAFVYRSIIGVYAKLAYPSGVDNLSPELLKLRSREIRFFMVFGALPITLAIMKILGTSVFDVFKIELLNHKDLGTDTKLQTITGILPFLSSKGKKPNLLMFIFCLTFILLFNPFDIINYIQTYLTLKLYITFSLVSILILLLRYTILLILYSLNKEGNYPISTNYPKFVQTWLSRLNRICSSNTNKKYHIITYKRLLVIYTIVFFILITALFFL